MPQEAESTAQPLRVLILEDEVQVAKLLELGIRDWVKNPQIRCLTNGDDAWRAVLESEPDLLIMDFVHPGMDGQELLGKLIARKVRCKILLTSDLFSNAFSDGKQQNIQIKFVPKPFGLVQFWRALNEFIGPSDFSESRDYLEHYGIS